MGGGIFGSPVHLSVVRLKIQIIQALRKTLRPVGQVDHDETIFSRKESPFSQCDSATMDTCLGSHQVRMRCRVDMYSRSVRPCEGAVGEAPDAVPS